ncbi:MAG TPA: HAD family hydrolase [Prolixibacteraceae bacterium]|nr:HAD family hydrolase [Prolixibacteraceae bacterium]
MKGIRTILWDWNGTLLNDTDICVASINELLQERNLPTLSREEYLQVFDFPVIKYYQSIGFDFRKEPFEIPAQRYIERYHARLPESRLHSGAIAALTYFRKKNYQQLLLSASEMKNLETAIAHFHLRDFFDDIAGLDNIFAHSKSEIGLSLLKKSNLDPSCVCLIGDTLHDREVADAIGCRCLLIGNGHQAYGRLIQNGAPVLRTLEEIVDYFENTSLCP